MYRFIQIFIILFSLIICISCKNKNTISNKGEKAQQLESALNNDQLLNKIDAFYVQRYIGSQMTYSIKSIQLIRIEEVKGNYVDSLKSDMYQRGITQIKDNVNVRKNMIGQLSEKLAEYKKQGLKDKIDQFETSIQKLEDRNQIQENELKILKSRDSLVQSRLIHPDMKKTKFYQVDFIIRDQLDQLSRVDTSSLIFNADHQIEDLLNDRPWDGN
jgi:hypothetical protein